jgi:hypothetical protein
VQVAVDAKHKLIVEQQGCEPSCGYGAAGTDRRTGKKGSRCGADRGCRGAISRSRTSRPASRPGSILTCRVPSAVPRSERASSAKMSSAMTDQRQLFLPSGSASSSQFVFSHAWLEEGSNRKRLACRDCAIRSQCTGNVFRSVSRLENEAILDRMQPPMAQPPTFFAQRREMVEHPFWHDQAIDEPGCVSDARVGDDSRRVQPDRPRLQSQAGPRYLAAAKAD